MTPSIAPPDQNTTRSALADWLELQALGSATGRATIHDLFGVLDFVEDNSTTTIVVDDDFGEGHDDPILETPRNSLADAVSDELEHRKRILGSSYPFAISASPSGLVRSSAPDVTPGQIVYLFCLLASAIRENRIQTVDRKSTIVSSIANVFQVCACLAAGGYIVGQVISFGFPRKSKDNFITSLRSAYERFGAGIVRDSIPAGHPKSTKDDGIDVIAWRDHPDRMAGKLYLLGQCASGIHWKGKSVVDRVSLFHGWFSEPPASNYLPSMFIPFPLHRDLTDEPDSTFREILANKFVREERRYGIIFDRFRVVHFADQCLRTNGEELANVDGRERFHEVESWVEAAMGISGLAHVP